MLTPSNIVTGTVLAQFLIGVILFTGAFIIRREPMGFSWQRDRPSYSSLMTAIIILTLGSLGVLVLTDALVGSWQPLFSTIRPTFPPIRWPVAMTVVFIADILIVSYLVFQSGGSRESPFQPVYFLIPTLAIFLREPAWRVVLYVVMVGLLFSLLMGQRLSDDVKPLTKKRFTLSYWVVSIACLIVATLIGTMTAPLGTVE